MGIVSIIVSLVGFVLSFILGFPLSYFIGPFIGLAIGVVGLVLGIVARAKQRTNVTNAALIIGIIVVAVSILRMISLMTCVTGVIGLFA